MKFESVEDLVIPFLRQFVAVRVATQTPNPRPESFVQVRRTGGAAMNRVVERAQVTVTAWAKSEQAAEALAIICRAGFLNHYTDMKVVRRVEETGGLYYNPDPETGLPRYTFTVALTVRAPRSPLA